MSPDDFRYGGLVTGLALVALVVGVVLGLGIRGVDAPWATRTLDVLDAGIGVWVDLLRLLVLPLVVSHLFLAVRRLKAAPEVGRIGITSVGAFVLMLCLANAIAVGGAFLSFSVYLPDLSLAGVEAPAARGGTTSAAEPGLSEWLLDTLTSSNALFLAIVGSIVLGFLVELLPAGVRRRADSLGQGSSGLIDRAVRASLLATPAAAFALAFGFSARQGLAMAGALSWYLFVLSALLVVLTLSFYPLATLVAGIPMRAWARALLPPQVLAVATRSSLATVPALLDAGRELRLPAATREFVVPFAASTFKPSTAISGPASMVFLALAFDVPLSIHSVAGFLVADALLSVSDVGIPSTMPRMKSLALYVALGIPVEGYVLARSVAVLSDVLKTVANTTGYLTAAAVVTGVRSRRRSLSGDLRERA